MKTKYYLNPNGEFIIENYNFTKPFASFFPGIAGKYGIPMWVFYVNRGQAIASFGIKDKDHAILEFFPANKSWQLTSLRGFRSFIKVIRKKKIFFWEPFQNGWVNSGFKLTHKMSITSFDLKLEEINFTLGLKVKVEYFTIPHGSYAALARIVSIENVNKFPQKIQLVDGLPQIVPYGTSNLFLKKLGRTIEAWMKVENLKEKVAFYKLDIDPTDRPEVVYIVGGNFYLAFHYEKEKPKLILPIVDPELIFGYVTDFSYPQEFLKTKKFTSQEKQITQGKTPSGFAFLDLNLKQREEKTLYSVIGHMRDLKLLNDSIKKIIAPGYLKEKKEENQKLIQELQQDIETKSSSLEFDLYAKQTYLDNILRGGYPVVFKSQNNHSVFYLYSRKHGDLERDYNKFQLQPTYFSQGNGNYRDVNQNRRCDVWFNPEIKDKNIILLINLIQADGFNPLVIKGSSFLLKNPDEFKMLLSDLVEEKYINLIISFLNKPFTPGEIILFLEDHKIKPKVSYDDFLNIILAYSQEIQEAEHGEGFWIDHWHYNLDLLESYLGIYPENLKELLFEKRVFTFYDNSETVKPRAQKYMLRDGKIGQFHAVAVDNAKREMLKKRTLQPHCVRMEYGKGEIYQTTLINKLICILVNKLACLDPFGCGIEMEADKPNWFDALNGLPGLLGSSLCETFELKRLILFIKDGITKTRIEKIYLSEEIYEFLWGLNSLLIKDISDYEYWDKSNSLKEDYRHKTRFGFSGKEEEISIVDLTAILDNALKKVNTAIKKAQINQGLYASYFINEVVEYEKLKEPFIKPKKFKQIKLPLFLEGQMHALRLSESPDEAKKIYKVTKKSKLYDKKLKMYKINVSLTNCPFEIGRARVFPRGWLEHESIWLHMEYKYLLEVLKNGLYEEFYQDFRNVLIPFQDPKRYGRSILENSSFLVSSVFTDKNLHGNGFVARLSGSTAEFLQIWLMMNIGPRPFALDNQGKLILKFAPILAGWLFDLKGKYTFNFLSKICVTYHNPKRKNTFGKSAVKPKKIVLYKEKDKPIEIPSDTIPSPFAQEVRERKITKIDLYLA
ncbi:MAG: cellobiose phosphorylase [Candidatus Omnitrophica bacterium]|nr:cellobiose phosphorylase [Candidatus Omnitrophota bacterium]